MPFYFKFKVSYISYSNGADYRVARNFTSYEAAEEFINVNARICPLPGLIRHYIPFTGRSF